MIVTEFGKFRYNCLPMGMCASEDILQAKVDKLLGDIEEVKTYICDIIVLRNDYFEKHIGQLKMIYGRLPNVGLKFNDPNCSFFFKDIPYLGCVLTREGIKHDP